jgi:DNA-directed RNA polymerase
MDESRLRDDIPYAVHSMYSNPLAPPTRQSLPYELRPFDPSTPLLVKNDRDPFPRSRMSPHGIPGDVESMLSVFDACLQVDHLDRAALVLKRFGDMDCLPGPDLMKLHNRYLCANLDRFYTQPDPKWAASMQTWYETRIRGSNLPQTPETIACMLKVSLLSTDDEKVLRRKINRYMGITPEDEATEVYSMAHILSDEDLHQITSLLTIDDYSPNDWVIEAQKPLETELVEDAQSPKGPEDAEPIDTSPYNTDVKAVPQKGLGLKTLREILGFFSDIKGRDISQCTLAEQREIQGRLERDCVDAALERWREEHQNLMKMGKNTSLATNALNTQLYDWQCALEKKIAEEFALFEVSEATENKNQEDLDRCLIAPFMRQSDPTRLAALSILSILNSMAQGGADHGTALSNAVQHVSKAVEEDVKTRQRNTSARKGKLAKQAQRRVFRRTTDGASQAAPAQMPEPTADSRSNVVEAPIYDTKSWPIAIRTKIGATLLLALVDSVKVTVIREHPETKLLVSQIQPAFAKTSIFKKGKRIGMIMANKFLVDLLKKEPRGDFLARHLPMLVQPDPWTKFDKGGFLEFPSTLLRIKNGEKDQKIYAEAAVKRGDLDQLCKGLDVLGRTAWRINGPVFNVMLEAWNTGEPIANLPPLNPNIPVPPEPEASEDPMQRRLWIQAVKAVENQKSGLHSERCFMNFQMEIANAFKDQTFYFPHNMDFRGRAYPIPTYLNHMGADNARALLRFANGKELGENGLRWLKVHLANVYGYDKASITEREAFTMENLDNIFDSAAHPLDGKRWWLKAEDRWQCLAACFELRAALQSPEPTKYVSSLPVHQDGTCNGLQHYAALGGDLWGAQQVNLEPGDRPADVYSAVADLVKEGIAEDVKTDNVLAKAMEGKITRKVVKQTVMTNVYGVTYIGARAQVQKQIESAYPNIHQDTGIHPILLASYVATKIFKALSTMFRGAHDIQYWLGECAGRVCRALTPEQLARIAAEPEDVKAGLAKKPASKKAKSAASKPVGHFKSTIVWTTPLRLPVVQPYRMSDVRTIQTTLQDLNLTIPERSDPVNRRKQLQAFPPNFIHSLDATHMLLSALECDDLGLSFAAVHDSFWTHAGDIDTMNRVLRDAFIRIHSEDVIQRLASEFEARYKGSIYLAKVEQGSPAEKAISAWNKKGKLSWQAVALLEWERLQLLQSADPAEVEKGRQMETPGSIFESFAGAQEACADEDMSEVGLGHVPSAPSPEKIAKEAKAKVVEAEDLATPGNSLLEDPEAYTQLGGFEAAVKTGPKKRGPSAARKNVTVWLPLSFPKIPQKVSSATSPYLVASY